MITVDDVRLRLRGQAIVGEIDDVNGYVRIQTRFLYPDGAFVDVFATEHVVYGAPYVTLTDLGQTYWWLVDCTGTTDTSPFEQIVDDVKRLHDVRRYGAMIECDITSLDDLIYGVIRLGQACARVAEIARRA